MDGSDGLLSPYGALPVFVISFNNGTYVRNMVHQLLRGTRYVVGPCTDEDRAVLAELEAEFSALNHKGVTFCVHWMPKNYGYKVLAHPEVWSVMGVNPATLRQFVVTDPDLQFHPHMPRDALETLSGLAISTGVPRTGLALDISKPDDFVDVPGYPVRNCKNGGSIVKWESQFWRTRVQHDTLEVYAAPIDTTFCVITPEYCKASHPLFDDLTGVRVTGPYTCKHLPWYKVPLLTIPTDEREWYARTQASSSLLNALEEVDQLSSVAATGTATGTGAIAGAGARAIPRRRQGH